VDREEVEPTHQRSSSGACAPPHACPASVAPNMLAGLSVWAAALVNRTPFAGARDYALGGVSSEPKALLAKSHFVHRKGLERTGYV
jgi:hypothetical protein